MRYQTFKKKPEGFILTIDGKVVESAGVKGLIKREDVARTLRDIFRAQQPESEVLMFGWFK